jgi:ABC-type transport system substrate-binding protein
VDLGLDFYPADLSALHSARGRYTIFDTPSFVYEHLELNVDPTFNGKPNPLANQKVRLAMALALNKAAILQSALGLSGAAARQMVANNPWVSRPGFRQPFTDAAITGQWDPLAHAYITPGSRVALRDARRLLRSTPWKAGFSLGAVTTTAQLPARAKLLDRIGTAWSKLGIKLTITTQQDQILFGTWAQNGTLDHGRFQVALFSWVGSPEADAWVNELGGAYVDRRQTVHSDLDQNYSGFVDATIDRAFSQASSTYDPKVRGAAYRAIQRELNHQAYWIGLYYRDQIATSDGRIKHFKPNPTLAGATWNAYDWAT